MVSCFVILTVGCKEKPILSKLKALEKDVSNPTKIEDLEQAIKMYEDELEMILSSENKVAVWYKMLGVRYEEKKKTKL